MTKTQFLTLDISGGFAPLFDLNPTRTASLEMRQKTKQTASHVGLSVLTRLPSVWVLKTNSARSQQKHANGVRANKHKLRQ